MAKGFGVKPARKKAKPVYPLVVSLQQKLQSGELVFGQSNTWDWMKSLTKAEQARFTQICNQAFNRNESSSGMCELILLAMTLQAMERSENEVSIPEDTLISQVKTLVCMGSMKELIDAGVVEAKDLPQRLTDTDRKFAVRLLQREV